MRPHPGCLRGLHLLFTPHSAIEPARLAEALQEEAGGKLVTAHERWGESGVTRLVLQFRFEVRLPDVGGELSFIHRVTAPPETRARDRAWFETQLQRHALNPVSSP